MDLFTVRRRFVNTFLDAPIIIGEPSRLLIEVLDYSLNEEQRTIKKPSTLASFLVDNMPPADHDYQLYDPRDLGSLLDSLPTRVGQTYSMDAFLLAKELYESAQEAILRKLGSDACIHHASAPCAEVKDYLVRAELFVQFVDAVACSRAKGSSKVIDISYRGHRLVGNQYVAAWKVHDSDIVNLLPYEAVLMWKDMCLTRSGTFLGISTVYDNDPEMLRLTKEVLQWCIRCLEEYGNKGYEILKQLESVTKATVVDKTDPIFKNEGVLKRMLLVVREKEDKAAHQAGKAYLADELSSVLNSADQTPHLVELFGLMKLTGHPLIDPRVGGKSAAHEASIPRNTSYANAKRLRNNWRRLYLEGFVKKTRRWPRMKFTTEGRSTRLYQLYSIRERNLPRSAYPLSDWDHVHFEPHQDFEYYANFLDLMDDKSISYYLSEFRATWRSKVKVRSHRRLLLEMLSRPSVSIKAIVDSIEAGDMPEDWLIVSLYPKEREFKLEARMFSMMVFEMRAFFACLEANLADKIFPHLSQQTMTLPKDQIQIKLFHGTTPSSRSEESRLFLEIDLSRWNLRWRDLPIRLIGEDLNDIFGLRRAYTTVHEFFRAAMILVRVNGFEPDGLDCSVPPASSLLWYHHEGGFEGIAQKHWTIATYSMIDLALQRFDIRYQIVGQADNQIILAYVDLTDIIEPGEYLRDLSRKVALVINEECAKVGQDAKPEECVESTTVVTYSKDFYINGADYYLSLKTVSRILPRGMSELPTLINCTGSISSACVAASEKLVDPFRGYFLMLFHTSRYLLSLKTRVPVESLGLSRRTRKLLTTDLVRKLLLLPSSLGGLPVSGPAAYLYKGGADPLSKDLAGCFLHSAQDVKFLQRCIGMISRGKWTDPDPDPSKLLLDPYSLPLRNVQLAENKVQRICLDHTRSVTKNEEIYEVFGTNVDDFEANLVDALLKVRPFNPALLSDVMEYSVVGVRRKLTKMFTATRTIQDLAGGDEKDPGGIIIGTSASSFSQIIHRLSTLDKHIDPPQTVYDEAKRLRKLWINETLLGPGETMSLEGVTAYTPFGWEMTLNQSPGPTGQVQIIFTGSSGAHTRQGEYEPYLGKETIEKRTKYGYTIVVSSAADKASQSLYRILTQPGVHKSFKELIRDIAFTRTGTDILALEPYSTKTTGGSVYHRYKSTFDKDRAAVVGCSTLASHILFQSDYAGDLSASVKDTPMPFQEFYTCGIGLVNFLYHRGLQTPFTLSFTVPDTLDYLPDADIMAQGSVAGEIPRMIGNSLVYTNDLSLIKQERPHPTLLMTSYRGGLLEISAISLAKSMALRELRRGDLGQYVADTRVGNIRLVMDILEFRGLGLHNILMGVSFAIAQYAREALYARSIIGPRWDPLPLIGTLSDAFSRSISLVTNHPLFKQDPLNMRLFFRTEMKYSRRRATRSCARYIAYHATVSYSDPLSSLTSDVNYLFQDDDESASADAIISIVRSGLTASVSLGEIRPQDVLAWDREGIIKFIKDCDTSETRLAGLYRGVTQLCSWSDANFTMFLSPFLRKVLSGSMVVLVDTSLQEALRGRRSSAMTHALLSPIDPPDASHYPGEIQFDLRADSTAKVFVYTRPEPSVALDLFNFARRRKRVFGMDAPAVYTYFPARRALRGTTLMILGSGNGGCAAVAGVLGIEHVILHDLRSDLAPENWLSPAPDLPILQRVTTKSHFTRSTAGYLSCGGDLLESSTWSDLSEMSPIGNTIVVDIPLLNHEEVIKILSLSARFFPQQPVVLRWINSLRSMDKLLSVLRTIDADVEAYSVYQEGKYAEMITRHCSKGTGWGEFLVEVSIPLSQWAVNDEDMSWAGGDRKQLVVEHFGELAAALLSSQSEPQEVDPLVSSSAVKSLHGFSYRQWTQVLMYLLFQQLSSEPLDIQEKVLKTFLETGSTKVLLGRRSLVMSLTQETRVFLLQVLPRLIGP